MINFSGYVEQIKLKFKKDQLKTYSDIQCLDHLNLASIGDDDTEGYQIFTPQFIVRQMTEVVGRDILNFSKTILEPTSGDGAFTTYILKKRLETIQSGFEIESLKALSTIYSIEMDKNLISKQRNNIFTLIKSFIDQQKIIVDSSYFEIVKCILTTNFIWAMFNFDNPIKTLLGTEVAYKMPNASKKDYGSISFPVWTISAENISFQEEGVEI